MFPTSIRLEYLLMDVSKAPVGWLDIYQRLHPVPEFAGSDDEWNSGWYLLDREMPLD